MNESMQTHPRKYLRRKLLLTVSSAVLLVTMKTAMAEDTDRPVLWIELGGAFDQISRGETGWVPPNLTPPVSATAQPFDPFGLVPNIGYDVDAAINFEPDNSQWVYSASVRYGRSLFGPKHQHSQVYSLKPGIIVQEKYVLATYDFADAVQRSHASHAILDFTAGRDVGLGTFNGGKSTVHFGVRVAQLNERSNAQLTAFVSAPNKYSTDEVVHKADAKITRDFSGIGPSIAWDSSLPFVGSLQDGVSFDWGANAALLFGKQKTSLALHTDDTRYYNPNYGPPSNVLSHSTGTLLRNKTVVVPNLGGFAGLSWCLPNAKLSFGYRADFFFSVIDGGVSTSKTYDRGFYGPFANISIGIGG